MKALVVGCGSIGRRHLRNLAQLGVDEIAVVEPRLETTTDLGPLAARYASWEEGLSWQPEVVLITSPTEFHLPQAVEAARQGCHLFIEKPLSHSLEGLESLEQILAERRLVSLVGCNMRFHHGPATVKRLLGENAVGAVVAARLKTGSYLPKWRPQTDYRQSYSASQVSGGVILDCIHEIDLACWLFGGAELKAAVLRPATTIGLPTDGLAELLLSHRSGVLSSVHLNYIQRDYRRGCEVIGSEGTIHWDFQERRVWINRDVDSTDAVYAQPEAWELNRMYVDELEHFLQCVKEGRESCNPVSHAIATLEIALAARRAGQSSLS